MTSLCGTFDAPLWYCQAIKQHINLKTYVFTRSCQSVWRVQREWRGDEKAQVIITVICLDAADEEQNNRRNQDPSAQIRKTVLPLEDGSTLKIPSPCDHSQEHSFRAERPKNEGISSSEPNKPFCRVPSILFSVSPSIPLRFSLYSKRNHNVLQKTAAEHW